MRQFVIFSEKELSDMYLFGDSVVDEANNITYMSEDAYKRYLEEKREEDQW